MDTVYFNRISWQTIILQKRPVFTQWDTLLHGTQIIERFNISIIVGLPLGLQQSHYKDQ